MPPTDLDLNAMFGRASVQVDPEETDEERAARLKQEIANAKLARVKEYVVFFVVVGALIAVGVLCAYEGFLDPAASADTKRWAQTTLSALFAGSLSFVLGQATARRSH
jgi:predicted nucleic acid-binding Zn ribbon protein